MVRNLISAFIINVVIFSIAGCSTWPIASSGKIFRQKGDQSASNNFGYTGDEELSAYYYYTQSHLMQRRGDLESALELLLKTVSRDHDSLSPKVELAKLYLNQRDNQKALAIVEEILEKSPNHLPSLIMLGNIYSVLDEYSKAIDAYKTVLSLDESSERTYLLLGSQYEKNKQPHEAIETYRALLRLNPQSLVGQLHLGMVASSIHNYDIAIDAFRKCLEINADYQEPAFQLAHIYEVKGDNEAVIETYKEILERNPDNIKAYMGLGHFYLKLGRNEQAADIFDNLIERYSEEPELLRQIGLLYLDYKEYEKAINALKMLTNLSEPAQSPEIYYFLGMAYEGLNMADQALDSYKQVPITSAYYRGAVVHMSFLYQEQGNPDIALKLISEAIEKEPGEVDYYLVLGAIQEDMKNYDDAISTFQQGLEVEPEHVRLRFRLGVVFDKAGDKQSCIAEMRRVIKVEANHVEALNYLGYTYVELGTELDEAEELILKAMKHRPDDGYITDSLGWLYYKKGDYLKAVETLEKAAELSSNDAVILEHLADAYLKIEATDKALKYYKLALDKKHNDNTDKDKALLKQKIDELEKKLAKDI